VGEKVLANIAIDLGKKTVQDWAIVADVEV